jgi:hypothetical protein
VIVAKLTQESRKQKAIQTTIAKLMQNLLSRKAGGLVASKVTMCAARFAARFRETGSV